MLSAITSAVDKNSIWIQPKWLGLQPYFYLIDYDQWIISFSLNFATPKAMALTKRLKV